MALDATAQAGFCRCPSPTWRSIALEIGAQWPHGPVCERLFGGASPVTRCAGFSEAAMSQVGRVAIGTVWGAQHDTTDVTRLLFRSVGLAATSWLGRSG